MCHVVETAKTRTFLGCDELLVGKKEFAVSYNNKRKAIKLESRVLVPYEYKLRLLDNGRLVSENGESTQDLEFRLHEYESNSFITTRKTIKAGFHISAFLLLHNKIKENITTVTANYAEIPVGFFVDDVLFFDGYAVSVDKFFILTPEEVNKFCHHEEETTINFKQYCWFYDKLVAGNG